MVSDCHIHIGAWGRKSPDYGVIRSAFASLREQNVAYCRDGGDKYGICTAAKPLAKEYGISYAVPGFIIHKAGLYGSIYGKAYRDIREYRALIREAGDGGADFIKIAVSGIVDFEGDGRLIGDSIPLQEQPDLIKIAAGEGFAVMVHCNGADNIKSVSEAAERFGAIVSIEHGFGFDDSCIPYVQKSGIVWVPTCAPVAANIIPGSRFDAVKMRSILENHTNMLKRAARHGIMIACGSDTGAYGVSPGDGTALERETLLSLSIDTAAADAYIKENFRRK